MPKILKNCILFFRRETVLCIAAGACCPAGAALCFFRSTQCRLYFIYRLGHPCPFVQSDGGDERVSKGRTVCFPGKSTVKKNWDHTKNAACSGLFTLCLQHGHHKRRFADHFCAIRYHRFADGKAGASSNAAGGYADRCRQFGQHADSYGQPTEPLFIRQVRDGIW